MRGLAIIDLLTIVVVRLGIALARGVGPRVYGHNGRAWSMRLLAIVLLAFSVFSSPPAFAAFLDGNDLHQKCTSASVYDKSECLRYVQGAADTFAMLRSMKGQTNCIPSGVNAGQLMDMVTKELVDNPADRHYNAVSFVYAAILKGFPACRG